MKVTFILDRMMIEVLIVGAGPAGIGCALALRRAGIQDVLVLEAGEVGTSFRRWPEQMRLITPSFHGNPFFSNRFELDHPGYQPSRLLPEGAFERA